MSDEELIGFYGKIRKNKVDRFKKVAKKVGKIQNFAIEEALDDYCNRIERSIS